MARVEMRLLGEVDVPRSRPELVNARNNKDKDKDKDEVAEPVL